MIQRVHSLELENFMLYRKFKRVFGDKDIIGLIGNNKEGKTTILEAFGYALHGLSRAEREVELIHHGADKMMVTLTLLDDGKKIVIKRGRDCKNNGLLEIHGVEKKGEAQSVINALIGFDKEEFTFTNFFLQGQINMFMELGPTDKKKYLMKWLKNTRWVLLEKAVSEDMKEVLKKLLSVKSKLEVFKEDGFNELAAKKKMKRLRVELEVKDTAKKKLEKQLATIRASRKVMVDTEIELDQLNKRREEKQDAKDDLIIVQKELEDLYFERQGYVEKIEEDNEEKLRDKKVKASNEINALDNKISRAKNDMTGNCPILNEACDRIECDSNQIKKWRIARKKACVLRGFAVKGLELLKQYQGRLDAIKKQEFRRDQAKAQVIGWKDVEARIKVLEARRLDGGSDKVKDIKNRIEGLQDEMREFSEWVGQLKAKLTVAVKSKLRIEKLEREVIHIQKEISRLRYLGFMFGKNGIPSQEIENAFDEIEDEINFVLERLGTRLQIEFKADRELQPWEDFCVQCGWQYPKGTRTRECDECGANRLKKRKDELQLRVLEDGEDQGFHMESGGGKTLVSLSVRLALIRLKQRQTNSKFPILFLDEPDAALDRKNKKAFIDLITKTLLKDFGFEQIFWISHDPEIQESIPHVLHVQRKGKESKTKWVA